jgi:hypothetical protein
MSIQVYDKDLSTDELVATVTMPLEQLAISESPLDLWLDLENESGSLHLEFTYNYHYSKVLHLRKYSE